MRRLLPQPTEVPKPASRNSFSNFEQSGSASEETLGKRRKDKELISKSLDQNGISSTQSLPRKANKAGGGFKDAHLPGAFEQRTGDETVGFMTQTHAKFTDNPFVNIFSH